MIAAHYLTVPDVVAVQGALCGRYGARPGVRNLPLLRDTLAGLKEGGHADLIAQAAALFACLAFDRPFFEGHARVAFAATDVFLRINGHRVGRNPQSLVADLTRITRDPGGARLVDPWLRGIVSAADSSTRSD